MLNIAKVHMSVCVSLCISVQYSMLAAAVAKRQLQRDAMSAVVQCPGHTSTMADGRSSEIAREERL